MESMDRTAKHCTNASGFSRIDLSVVIAVAAIGFALLLPALRTQRSYAGTLVGGSNMKRLTAAWHLYAIDNGEKLPPNSDGGNAGIISSKLSWVAGWLNYDPSNDHNTNTSHVAIPYGMRGGFQAGQTNRLAANTIRHYGGLLGYYESDPLLFRNPNDSSPVIVFGRSLPRARSVSMNLMLGLGATGSPFGWALNNVDNGYRAFPRLSSFAGSSPSETFVLIEEHPDSINDGHFIVDLRNPNQMVDWTANFSNGGFWMSFADGRVDLLRFRGANFQRPHFGQIVSTANLSADEQTQFQRVFRATSSR